MKKQTLLLVALLLAFTAFMPKSHAQWKKATVNGYTYQYIENDPLKARFYTLKNGLKVILAVNKKEPRVRTLTAVRAGSNTDPRSNTGLAHYLEHLLFKGTDKYGALDWEKEKPLLDKIDALYEQYNKEKDEAKRTEIYKEIDKVSGEAAKFAIANEYDKMITTMGGQNSNAHTWVEETVYEEDIPSNAIDRYLTLQAERYRNPILRIFHTELEAVYEEKNRSLDSDDRKLNETLLSNLFPTHNYGQQSTIGTIEHLKRPSLVEIRNYYNKFYVPNNMAVIMVGDINPDELVKKVDAAFGYMQPKPVEEYNPPVEAPITTPLTGEVWGPTPERLMMGFRMPGEKSSKETLLLTVCDEILSNSAAGLIDLNLNKQQKVLSAGCTPLKFKDYSVEMFFGSPKQGQSLDEVKSLIFEQIEKLKKGEFDEGLIRAIVANFKLRDMRSSDNNNYIADALLMKSFIQTKGENWSDVINQTNMMSKITKQEVVEFANKYFQNNYMVIYKRQGEDKRIQKVPKPTITPVATNNDKASPFLQTVNAMPMQPIQPTFLDYKKDFKTDKVKGLDVYYVQNPRNSLFRLTYRFDMGSWNSRLLPLASQYLQFLNTDKYTSEQISKEFYNIACSYQMNVGNEETTIQISGLQENFDKAVSLLEHILTNCKADENAWNSLRNRLQKARKDAKANRPTIRQAMAQYAQFGAKNPFNNVLTDAEMNALKGADLVKILNEMFKYSHQIVYFGPTDLATFKGQIQKNHSFASSFMPNPAKNDFRKVEQTAPQVLYTNYDMVQAEINWVLNTESYNVNNSPIVSVYNNYFGAGGFTCIVFQTIRESKALAYSTFAFYSTPLKQGDKYTMTGYVGTQADKLGDAVASMNELLNDLPQVDDFLKSSKIAVKNNIETGRVKDDDIVFDYFTIKKRGLETDERKIIYEGVDKVTFEDLKKFHTERFSKKPYTMCVVASDKKINVADLNKYGAVKTMTLEELFGY